MDDFLYFIDQLTAKGLDEQLAIDTDLILNIKCLLKVEKDFQLQRFLDFNRFFARSDQPFE